MGDGAGMDEDFNGAKVALFIGEKLLVMLRDDIPTIPHPNVWDFPGGGREGAETPIETLAREVHEEFGLVLPEAAIIWRNSYESATRPGTHNWFFIARMPVGTENDIVFGDEGQRWDLMTEVEFAALPNHHPPYVKRLADWHATHTQ